MKDLPIAKIYHWSQWQELCEELKGMPEARQIETLTLFNILCDSAHKYASAESRLRMAIAATAAKYSVMKEGVEEYEAIMALQEIANDIS